MPEPTVTQLPRRRGVVMREHGIEDSYGTKYDRQPSGSLKRTSPKSRRAPARMFSLEQAIGNIDAVIEVSKHETENLNTPTA